MGLVIGRVAGQIVEESVIGRVNAELAAQEERRRRKYEDEVMNDEPSKMNSELIENSMNSYFILHTSSFILPPYSSKKHLSSLRTSMIFDHGGSHGNHSCSRRCRATVDRIQEGHQQPGAAQSAGRNVPAAGEVQRRADLGAAARRRRAGRPDLGRRVRPDGRHRRLRPVARREVRDLLRAAHPRRHARRAAHDGLGAAAGPLEGQQAQRGRQERSKPGSAARPPRTSWPQQMQHLRAPSWRR